MSMFTALPKAKHTLRQVVLALAVVVATALAGCGQQGHTSATPANSPTPAIVKISASWRIIYHDLPSLKKAADLVILGTVQGNGITTIFDPSGPGGGYPNTDFTVSVEHALHDPRALFSGTTVIVSQLGGDFHGQRYEVDDDPLLRDGQRVVLFLHQYSPGHFSIIGGPSGRFTIVNGVAHPINDEGVVFSTAPSEAAFLIQVAQA